MKAQHVTWSAGETAVQSWVARALAEGLDSMSLRHQSPRRSVHRLVFPVTSHEACDGERVMIKVYHTATGRHPLRERLKRRFGWSPARREWKALQALYSAGVPVARPRAWGRLTNRDEIVVTDYLEGDSLADRFNDPAHPRTEEILNAMASTIKKLHDAGYRHGDLHLGNLFANGKEIALLDLQRARPQRNPHDRLWDLARLELSLAKAGWDPAARMTLRDRLDVGDAFDPILRRFLRDHLRGRARRLLRIGRNWSAARIGRLQGLRDVCLDEATLASLLESCKHEGSPRERREGRVRIIQAREGKRVVIIKSVAAGNLRRALGDRLRGSPAARAFRAGQASHLLTNRAARPLAFLEERHFGLPLQSWLFLEKVGDEDLDCISPSSPESQRRMACALGEWLADGHAWGLSHRDLKAGNLRVAVRPDAIQFWMIDLEDLSGPAERSDEARLHGLGQLNASLADDILDIEARLAALESYQARVPFSSEHESVAGEIARRSLARAHRWQGDGCDCLGRG
jgi:tRNA A-37 threonylcarbamoyl transferase component Bud32